MPRKLHDPHPLRDLSRASRQRFCSFFSESERTLLGCILWCGHKDRKGYGQFKMGRRAFWAHRCSYAFFVGAIPPGRTVEHTCRNPSCVNPKHLTLLGNKKNAANGNRNRKQNSTNTNSETIDGIPV